ncbi:MAG: primosomal protein N' [Candidatus Marinimicrobia bacterium]|jgi:primosomal protein N' (replication factor Y)|nr:primosomal protein N' [Candidatus Neomarinimicrobiota bacterium]MDP6500360.1 primosomal protein N' [Candidatus Neomarinimicrobiota bacterium]MDP6726088.1 primosomal protein N' [Candidatus Neomarinimicrobiota bacterium]|tara:strand:- start:12118 stop:14352 length:2235 start_codon:yes stop_codon:yes gene_type:complete
MIMFAEVAFPISSYCQFTYKIPKEFIDSLQVGTRVKAPLGNRMVTGIVVNKSAKSDFKGKHKQIKELVDHQPVMDKKLWKLVTWMSKYYFTPIGQVVKTVLPSNLSAKYTPPTTSIISFKTWGDDYKQFQKKSPAQAKVLKHLSTQKGAIPISSLKNLVSNPSAISKTLFEKDLVDLDEVTNLPDITGFTFSKIHKEIKFTDEQQLAIDDLSTKLNSGKFSPTLLHGVTGSGKTEIYIELVRQALEQNKSAILLLPEISLTPQIAGRFRAVFDEQVALWHSKLSHAARAWTWKKICSGEFNVVIGARSAIFAPIKNIGVIIIDEEQENSFKQDSPEPRYHARDIALMRGKLHKAVVLMSSATPSLDSYYNYVQGKYDYIQLNDRFGGAPYPQVYVVDMIKEQEETGKFQQVISSMLQQKMERKFAKGEQVILLQNRRGFAPIMRCGDCGHVETCVQCEIALTYHSYKRMLKCHFCGFETGDITTACQKCSSINIKLLGVGTQKVEDIIADIFSNIKVARIDYDTTRKITSMTNVLEQFSAGKIDVLIGTQMIAKGLDFDNATLVGIVNGDTGLFLPDFRSGEKVFQLIYQAAGRSGRRKSGEVVIQTYNPDNPVLKHAAKLDQKTYYNIALSERRELQYAPFSWMIRIEIEGAKKEHVNTTAEIICSKLRPSPKGIIILGPANCYRERLRSKYRMHIILKSNKTYDINGNKMHKYLQKRISAKLFDKIPSGVKAFIDVNPVSVL